MCYSAIAVANFFIDKAKKTATPISNMHLQKMIFFAHAAYFKQFGKPLVSDPVTAWRHGPVIESLYHELKRFGKGNITEPILRLAPCDEKNLFPCRVIEPVVPEDDHNVVSFLTQAWNKLSAIETWRLRALSHAEGGAWFKTVKSQNIDPDNDKDVYDNLPRNLTILDSAIQECGR